MTDQLVKELLDIVRSSKEFVLAQAPDVAREIVLWGRVESALLIALALALVVFAHTRAKVAVGMLKKEGYFSDAESAIFASHTVLGIVALVVAVITFAVNLHSLVMSWSAPKLYLLEYLSSLVTHK